MRLSFLLTLQSDYHIGAGHGLGSQVDSALLRDSDGVPMLRGSTVTGLLRDGLWRLLQTPPFKSHRKCKESGLRGDQESYCAKDHCPLCRVFGTPKAMKRWRFSSARPAGIGTQLMATQRWRGGQMGAQIAARVRVNPRLRRAEARKLFKQEEGDGRLAFAFTINCATNDIGAHHEAALLVAAARMVRRLGSARRRGRGACELTLESVEGWRDASSADTDQPTPWQSRILAHFEQKWLLNQGPMISVTTPAWQKPKRVLGTAKRFRLLVRTDEPMVIARRAEAGNIYDGVDFISGSTLLGAFAAEAAARWDLSSPNI